MPCHLPRLSADLPNPVTNVHANTFDVGERQLTAVHDDISRTSQISENLSCPLHRWDKVLKHLMIVLDHQREILELNVGER
jgi:hypothetical protein